ncbi:MAG: hypothetical protein IJA39_02100, partial [Clostridia bacterium]|nr:hypothetical protein [Clostridia bacterium]
HSLGAVVTLCVFSPHPQGFILPRRRLAPSPLGVPLTGTCEAQNKVGDRRSEVGEIEADLKNPCRSDVDFNCTAAGRRGVVPYRFSIRLPYIIKGEALPKHFPKGKYITHSEGMNIT